MDGQQIQARIFKDIGVLSPHYIPGELPFREREMEEIMRTVSPSVRGQKPKNLFIYGKPGTGKTCSVKKVVERLALNAGKASFIYINCRIYNSRYRIMQRILKQFVPELERSGFGLPFLYEKMMELMNGGMQIVVVLDEVDMVKDLDELIYTITRSNDEVKGGGASIIGISNKLSFKNALDPRSKSSLYENEMSFAPYTAPQLQEILRKRAQIGLLSGTFDESAINLTAAVAAQETGDARYALKLFEKAGEIAESTGKKKITDAEVEAARKRVDIDLAGETIGTLPENHQLVLYAIAKLTLEGSKYSKLEYDHESGFLISGEVYEEYERTARAAGKRARSSRWYKEYLGDLEVLGLITLTLSGRGVRGHTTLIKLGYDAKGMLELVGKRLGIGGEK